MPQNATQNFQFTEVEKVRWEKWKQGAYDGLTDEEIGHQFHRSRYTVLRLKEKAKKNGEYAKWADEAVGRFHEEYWELHRVVKPKNPELAYVEMGKRVDKTLKQRIETKGELESKITVSPPIELDGLTEYERKLLTDAAILYWRERNKKSEGQFTSIH